ncbi:hypothetical protein COCON_G00234160 [Conger conger]|uniref:Uncharacterized protein n=1 Tax=Conger conger TaxID=82655 RepID=A0A9Q1CUA2_CONCO|nr:hypothetical protein COCON_G00234160 [Conger conger]
MDSVDLPPEDAIVSNCGQQHLPTSRSWNSVNHGTRRGDQDMPPEDPIGIRPTGKRMLYPVPVLYNATACSRTQPIQIDHFHFHGLLSSRPTARKQKVNNKKYLIVSKLLCLQFLFTFSSPQICESVLIIKKDCCTQR